MIGLANCCLSAMAYGRVNLTVVVLTCLLPEQCSCRFVMVFRFLSDVVLTLSDNNQLMYSSMCDAILILIWIKYSFAPSF